MYGYILPSLLRSLLIYLSSFDLKITDIWPEKEERWNLNPRFQSLPSPLDRFGPETPGVPVWGQWPSRSPVCTPHTPPYTRTHTRTPPRGGKDGVGGGGRESGAPLPHCFRLQRGGEEAGEKGKDPSIKSKIKKEKIKIKKKRNERSCSL